MEKKINLTEAATKLAHEMTKDELFRDGLINDENEMVMAIPGQEETIYPGSVQVIFNRWYDYIFDVLEKCVVE